MEKILIVDDDVSIIESLKFAFKNKYELFLAHNIEDAWEHYDNNNISVTILDLRLGNQDGMNLYNRIREHNKEAIVIIVTAYGTIKSSIEAIKDGVFHYLTKPIDLGELDFLIKKGIKVDNLYKQLNILCENTRKDYEDFGIVSKSDSMKSILNIVEKIKNIDSNVLLTGDSGTGKGLIAKAIHSRGNRKNKKMYTINCAAIPKDLLESELFGYKKGAFTGATSNKKGYFELAHNSTLFLDEIGDMDILLQGKLLNVIQEKTITPLGAEKPIKIDVRIITATNQDLNKLVKKNKFREDLFYRLNVINIELPSLKERKEDIPYLINYFVYKYCNILNKELKNIDYSFINILEGFEFKGNIRELENIVERAIVLSDNETLTKKDVLDYISTDNKTSIYDTKKLIPIFVGEPLDFIEEKVIKATYEMYNYNQKETAKVLGITDRTIRNKLKKYKTEVNEND